MKPPAARQSSFLPDFCGVRIVFAVILIAELLAIVFTLVPPASDFLSDLSMNSLFIQWIALTSVAALCLARPYLNALPDPWAATLSYVLVLAIALLITEASWQIVYEWAGRGRQVRQTHGMFLLRCMAISAIISALALRYFYIQHQWRRQIESEARSRIQALQARIRPHFLFNCMNTIASLARTQPALAEQATEDLADLFRASLGEDSQTSTLEKELSLCRRYLRIEEHRLGSRLKVAWNVEGLPGQAPMPALTLQPLIENAIYHGIELLPEGGTVDIAGRHQGNRLELTIANPVPGENGANRAPGKRLALANVQERLSACFGPQAEVTTRIADGRYIAQLIIPCRDEDTDR